MPAGARETLSDLYDAGARVIAVGARAGTRASTRSTDADEQHLELVGFLVFTDRPKADAAASLARLAVLGIVVKVITGDSPQVAVKVCHDLGLDVLGALTGDEVDAMDDDALGAAIDGTTVFARVGPETKARIVRVQRLRGADVAFMGDGVNDAVALHHADVGISVDTGTDVAKDAADIILLDKDLGVLADGVVEGRRIFANTIKYVLMATSSNFGNMFSAAAASAFLSFLPMLPSQILLNNLLYDASQMTIPTDNVDEEMLARPSAWDLGFIRSFMLFFGPLSSIFDFVTFAVMIGVLHAHAAEFRTGWFVESLATQTLVIFVIRTRRQPFWRSRPSRPLLVASLDRAARRRAAAVPAVRPRARLHAPAARVLPDPDHPRRRVPRARRADEGHLLPPAPGRSAGGGCPVAARAARAPPRGALHAPRTASPSGPWSHGGVTRGSPCAAGISVRSSVRRPRRGSSAGEN